MARARYGIDNPTFTPADAATGGTGGVRYLVISLADAGRRLPTVAVFPDAGEARLRFRGLEPKLEAGAGGLSSPQSTATAA